jgi:hypothetical protein
MGALFVATRMLYYAAVALLMPEFEGWASPRSLLCLIPYVLHAGWFRGWAVGYLRRRAAARAPAAVGGAAAVKQVGDEAQDDDEVMI